MVYQDVTRNKNISASAKGLYAYLASFCGVSDECYPSIETIIREMGMVRDTYYRHINALVAAGVVEKKQMIGDGGKFGRTLYRVTHEVVISDSPITKNRESAMSISGEKETNSNNINSNNINSNNSFICPEPERPLQGPSGILLSLVDKTEYDVPLSKIEKWESAYPAVDVKQELHRMAAWLDSNPQRRKTRRGIDRFINSWLAREQDKGRAYNPSDRQQIPKPVSYDYPPDYAKDYVPRPDDPFQ